MVGRWHDCASCDDGATLVPLYDDCSGACVANIDARAFARSFGGAVLAESACSRLRACYDEEDIPIDDDRRRNGVFPLQSLADKSHFEWILLPSGLVPGTDDDYYEDDDYADWLLLPKELDGGDVVTASGRSDHDDDDDDDDGTSVVAETSHLIEERAATDDDSAHRCGFFEQLALRLARFLRSSPIARNNS